MTTLTTPKKTKKTPSKPELFNFAVGDLETDPFQDWTTPDQQRIPKAFAAGIRYKSERWVYWGPDCLRQVVAKAKTLGVPVYFHNGGNFDFHFLLPYIEPFRCVFLMVGGKRIVSITLPGLHAPQFLDSFALVPIGLGQWQKDKIDIRKLERDKREKNWVAIARYLNGDLDGLHSLMMAAHSRMSKLHLTQASNAFAKLRETLPEKLPKISQHFDDKFRPFYFAGRVQAFRKGKIPGRWDVYDINSAFPHSMCSLHWWGASHVSQSDEPAGHREQCFYDITCDARGCFPLRDGIKVEYPQGRFRFQVTGWELLMARSLGLVSNEVIHWVHIPSELMSYDEFILPLYDEKKDAETNKDAARRLFIKLEMNSSYGKFGESPDGHRDVICVKIFTKPKIDPKDVNRNPWEHCYDDEENGYSFFQRPVHGDFGGKPKIFRNVAIAASITGKVRATLMHAIHHGNAVYCDTDSVFVPAGTTGIPTGNGLGQWKHEFTFRHLWIGGRKLYAGQGRDPTKSVLSPLKWKTAAKGARLSPDDIVKVCEGKVVESRFAAPSFSLLAGTRFIARKVRMV